MGAAVTGIRLAAYWMRPAAAPSISALAARRLMPDWLARRPTRDSSRAVNRGPAHGTERSTGLDRDSAANVSLITAIDVSLATERAGKLSRQRLSAVLDGIETVLGR
jgi:hypothetical protein